jgi:SAM-dependent methyltransferase
MTLLRRFIDWNRRHCYALVRRYPRFFHKRSYKDELLRRIRASLDTGAKTVLEAGGIDRPLLARGAGFEYVGLDIEDKSTCYDIYDRFLVQSIEEPIDGSFDAIVSITLLEHVPNNRAAVARIFDALVAGGWTHHYVPGKGHPYALILRLVGPVWQKRLIAVTRAHSVGQTGYPTFFDHCTARRMAELFRRTGFEEIDVDVHYGANDYFSFFLPAFVLVTAFEHLCRSLGLSYFASGYVISGRKPIQPAVHDAS